MHHRFNWLISIIAGGCVGILVLWVMSSMVEVEPLIPLDQTDMPAVQLIGTRHQCNESFTELNRVIINSNSCQLDSDCALLMDSSLTFNQCFISVQSEKAGLVFAKLKEANMHCHDSSISACGHSTASAICKNKVCAVGTVEGVPRISLQELNQQTMKSINEDLQ